MKYGSDESPDIVNKFENNDKFEDNDECVQTARVIVC